MRWRGAFVLLSFVFLSLAGASLGCEWDYLIWIPRSPEADPLFRFIKGGKAGYIDQAGKIVIPATLPYYGGNYGEEFHDGLAEIDAANGVYVDETGKRQSFRKFERGWDFSEGVAVAMAEPNGKWGYINTRGEWAISPRFASSLSDYVWSFEGGFAVIEVKGRYGYIDHSGEFVIPPQFLLADSFHEGLAKVVLEGPCAYANFESPCPDSKILPAGMQATGKLPACKFVFIDTKGKLISDDRFDDAEAFSDGMAAVRIGEFWGFIDKTGTVVIAPAYAKVDSFSEGLAAVSVNGNFGYISKDGSTAISPRFKYAGSFSEGFAVVGNGDSEYWYIDRAGKRVFNSKYAAASPFFKGLAQVEQRGSGQRFEFIDHAGKSVFEYTR